MRKSSVLFTIACSAMLLQPAPFYAEASSHYNQFVIINAEEDGRYIICDAISGDPCYYSVTQHQRFSGNEEVPAYGDILQFDGDLFRTDLSGVNHIYESDVEALPSVSIIGSALDHPAMESKTAEVVSLLETIDGTIYTLKYDGVPKHYYANVSQPEGIDWSMVRVGDRVTMTYYGDVPVFTESISPLGDANSDNAVTIADVIFLNRQILGDTGTARSTFNQELADYDGNGIIDAADSLMILKRIVELI